ncbi:hypothetical protein CcaCcLH18_13919 [Colletotrichum camelliae]|nr:hypothetical protein CcaCcLH18_13919 [Colletotrichum camelliae]
MGDSENSTGEPAAKRQRLEATQPKTPVILEEFGDLKLRVGSNHVDEPTIFLVCSRTIARSSPVLKKMLYGGFAESLSAQSKNEEWVVDLPDDRPSSFKTFLHIIHGHFDKVPTRIKITNLYRLLELLDKYDGISLIRPWAKPWLRVVKNSRALPAALYIAWELAHKESFQFTMTEIVRASCIDNWGPPDAVDIVREMRHKLVSIHFEPYIELYKSLLVATEPE